MPLDSFVASLTETQRYRIAIDLIERLYPVWDEFAHNQSNLEYIDTVVGMEHSVDKDIVKRTVLLAKNWMDGRCDKMELELINDMYTDPIISLQDEDWEIDHTIELIFYSVYNLMRKVNGVEKSLFGEEQLYLVINQAADALLQSNSMTVDEINSLLSAYQKS